MSNLLNSMSELTNNKLTENGQMTHESTSSALVDLFTYIGSASLYVRKRDYRFENVDDWDMKHLISLFIEAYSEDADKALRIILWSRDILGGAKRRAPFKLILNHLANEGKLRELYSLVNKVGDLGRWDDIFPLVLHKNKKASKIVLKAINKNFTNPLLCKWLPRKGEVANVVRAYRKMTPKQYRKHLVYNTKVVEQLMSSAKWNKIDFDSLPQRALNDYVNAFQKNSTTFEKWVDGLTVDDVKSDTLYPHQVIKPIGLHDFQNSNPLRNKIADLQWKALPNFLEGVDEEILPVIDVSGSMGVAIDGNTTAMEVAVSLGLYVAERNNSRFRDHFITFSESPKLQKIVGDSLYERVKSISTSDWGYNTNFKAVAHLIILAAKQNNLAQSELPTTVMVFSDMQFDVASSDSKVDEVWKQMFKDAGYEPPKIVFWNLCGDSRQVHHGLSNDSIINEVGGFSPTLLRDMFIGGDTKEEKKDFKSKTSYDIMVDAIMKDRYKV
jgi:hypothetical protein